jgi:hypothetical protein
MDPTETPARLKRQTPKIPLWRRVVAPLFGLIPVIFFGGICYGCYWLSADEPIVTDEAYARMEVLKDVCRGEALIRYPADEKTQDADAEACSQRLWPTFVKPYLQYPDRN